MHLWPLHLKIPLKANASPNTQSTEIFWSRKSPIVFKHNPSNDREATGGGVGATLRESRESRGQEWEQRSSASLHSAAPINCPLLLLWVVQDSRVELAAIGAKDQEWAKDSLPLLCKNL